MRCFVLVNLILFTLVSPSLYGQDIDLKQYIKAEWLIDEKVDVFFDEYCSKRILIFRNGSSSCPQYVPLASKVGPYRNKGGYFTVLLFDDNGEDTSLYMNSFYGGLRENFDTIIVDRGLYQMLHSHQNTFTISQIDSCRLKFCLDVNALNAVSIKKKTPPDSVILQKVMSEDIIGMHAGTDSLLVMDRSINSCFLLFNLKSGNLIRELKSANILGHDIERKIYTELYEHGLTKLVYDSIPQANRKYEANGRHYFAKHGFTIEPNTILFREKNGYIVQGVFRFFAGTPEDHRYLQDVHIFLRLNKDLQTEDFVLMPISTKINGVFVTISKLFAIVDEQFYVSVAINNENERLDIGVFRSNRGSFVDLEVLGFNHGLLAREENYSCGYQFQMYPNDPMRFIIKSLPYIYDVHGTIIDTLDVAITELDEYRVSEKKCFSTLNTGAVEVNENRSIIYETRKDKMVFYIVANGHPVKILINQGIQGNGWPLFYTNDRLYYIIRENGASILISYFLPLE